MAFENASVWLESFALETAVAAYARVRRLVSEARLEASIAQAELEATSGNIASHSARTCAAGPA